MTTYATGNPLGSKDPRDLYDNAENFDAAMNDRSRTSWTDRLGVPRKTVWGMEQQVTDFLIAQGYESVYLTYGAGVIVARQTQLVQRAGELYRVMNASDIPLTLTGTWATDAPKLQAVGDAELRQALAAPDGTTKIGRGAGTLEDALGAAISGASSFEPIAPQRIALHYGACRGTGFVAGVEPGGKTSTLTTASAALGANRLYVANTASFFPSQLIVYLGADGDYYTAIVLSKDATSILLRTDIEVAVASGALVSNFYANESHPNTYGYYAIADYALRTMLTQRQVMLTWRATDGAFAVGGAILSSLADVTYENSGSSTVPAIKSVATGMAAGLVTPFYDLPAGNYVAKFYLTPNMEGSSDISVPARLSVVERTAVADTTIQVASPRGQTALVVELAFAKKHDSTVSFRMLNQTAGTLWSNIAKIEVIRVTSALRTLDKGKHVLLGDSWFAVGDIQARLSSKLPNATIVGKGVGGNRADQLFARFSADVVPEDPDVVWVMCGTNDVSQSIPLNTFGYNIGLLKSRIAALGARSIFFDCSVGSTAHSTRGDLLTNSRNFALGTDYLDDSDIRRSLERRTEVFQENFLVTIPASSTRRVCVFPGTTSLAATLERLYVAGQTASIVGKGNVRYGFGVSATTTISEDLVSTPFTASVLTALAVAKSNANIRFLLIEIQNTDVAAIDVIGFVSGTWTPA